MYQIKCNHRCTHCAHSLNALLNSFVLSLDLNLTTEANGFHTLLRFFFLFEHSIGYHLQLCLRESSGEKRPDAPAHRS